MGIVAPGFPASIVLELTRIHPIGFFVETGTFKGETTLWAATHFDHVHTIELSPALFERNTQTFSRVSNITPHLGDSRSKLPVVLDTMGEQPGLFWLDGHWSSGVTAGAEDECPLLDELALLAHRSEDLILIDDARFFLGAPPAPHDPACWPTLADIVHALPRQGGESFVQIIDDVIFVVPRKLALIEALIGYARQRPRAWQATPQNGLLKKPDSLGRRVGRKVRSLLAKM